MPVGTLCTSRAACFATPLGPVSQFVAPVRSTASDRRATSGFTTQTYTMSNGKIIYSKGRDHIIDAVRCAVLAVELDEMKEIDTNVKEIAIMPVTTKPIFKF